MTRERHPLPLPFYDTPGSIPKESPQSERCEKEDLLLQDLLPGTKTTHPTPLLPRTVPLVDAPNSPSVPVEIHGSPLCLVGSRLQAGREDTRPY